MCCAPFYIGYMRSSLRSHSRRGRSAGIHSMQAGSNCSILTPSCGLTHAHTHAYTGAYTHVPRHAHSHMKTQTRHTHSHMHAQNKHAHSQVHTHVCTYMHGHPCMCRPTCTGAYICVYTKTPLTLFCGFTCFSLPHAQPTPYYPRPGSHLWLILADINRKQC